MRVDLEPFEVRYRELGDPWDFAGSPYEQRKYELTVASLPRRDYARCFEPGASIGALSERLAVVADELVTLEASPTAATTARKRLRDRPTIDVRTGRLPEDWPEGSFDLIVLSEIGYYWDEAEWADIVHRSSLSLRPGGHLVGVHWLGDSVDHILHGSVVHRVLAERLGPALVEHDEPGFLLQVWEPTHHDFVTQETVAEGTVTEETVMHESSDQEAL